MDRNKQYKALYNAARNAIHPYWRNDTDRIKELRDMHVRELYGKTYRELTEKQLQHAINTLNRRKPYASPKQIKLLLSYALFCAIHYANFDNITYTQPDKKTKLSGEILRFHIYDLFTDQKGIPQNILRHLYTDWLNPTTHKLLQQGKYQNQTRNPQKFYYERLTPNEAQYLINRYREIASNIKLINNNKEILKNVYTN